MSLTAKRSSQDRNVKVTNSRRSRMSDKKKAANVYCSLQTDLPEVLSVYKNSTDHFQEKKKFIRRPVEEDEIYEDQLTASLKKESNSLLWHKKTKQCQLYMENICMEGTSKSRECLLLRRNMLLPKISPNGVEQTHIPLTRFETPDPFPDEALFAPCIYEVNKAKKGLIRQLTKRENGYTAVTEWVGCPEVTDEIRTTLGLNEENILSSLTNNGNEQILCDRRRNCHCVPTFPGLGIVGMDYTILQERLRLPVREIVSVEGTDKDIAWERNTEASSSLNTTYEDGQQLLATPDGTSPSRVSLSLAHAHLSWSTDPHRSKQWIVELGCSAELDKIATDWVVMKNTGTTAIHYNWVKKHKVNLYQQERCDQMRLVFDSWGGVILPGELYRIPFMYKAITAGHFSEDWQLISQPVLENGAEVIVRLWGFTRQGDQRKAAHEKIDEMLETGMKWSIVKHRASKIIDYLPLEETILADKRFPLIILGPDLFMYNNPWLHFNSSLVYSLGKISELIEIELMKHPESMFTLCSEEESENEFESVVYSSHESESKLVEEVEEEHNNSMEPQQLETLEPTTTPDDDTLGYSLADQINDTTEKLRKNIDLDTIRNRDISRKGKTQTLSSNISEKRIRHTRKTEHSNSTGGSAAPSKAGSNVRMSVIKPSFIATNFIDPDLDVNAMRLRLLQCSDNMVQQEALFTLMSEVVAGLFFRPFTPCRDWKSHVCKGLLISAMDKIFDYAVHLKKVCCKAEYIYESNLLLIGGEESSVGSQIIGQSDEFQEVNKLPPQQPPAQPRYDNDASNHSDDENLISNISSKPESNGPRDLEEFLEMCPRCHPRDTLSYERYKSQYYCLLYNRMYGLLSEVIDQMDTLLWQNKPLDENYGKHAFIKIDTIPMNIDVKSELEKPLPPRWIKIAERMADAESVMHRWKMADTDLHLTNPNNTHAHNA